MIGGYCMVDCTGLDLAAEGSQTITGLYDSIYDCMDSNKPIMFNNILIEGEGLITPAYGSAVISGTNIIVYVIGSKLQITNQDVVTILSE